MPTPVHRRWQCPVESAARCLFAIGIRNHAAGGSGWKARAHCEVDESSRSVTLPGHLADLTLAPLRFFFASSRLRVRHFACKVPIQGRSRAGKPELHLGDISVHERFFHPPPFVHYKCCSSNSLRLAAIAFNLGKTSPTPEISENPLGSSWFAYVNVRIWQLEWCFWQNLPM